MAQTTKRKETGVPILAKQNNKLPMNADQSQIDEFPLRQIAANFISVNEKDGLTKLDAFTGQIYSQFQQKYTNLMARAAWLAGVGVFLLIIAVITDELNPRYGGLFALVGLCFGAGGCFCVLSWRNFQYGSLPLRKPYKAIYNEADKDIALNLDKLFEHLQWGISPRAYYKQGGSEKSLDQKHFYGRLRFLLLSPHRPYRELAFRHTGFPLFSHELFMRVNIKAFLLQTNAKPEKPPKETGDTTYDYKAMLLLIIEHPALKKINPEHKRSIGEVKALIERLSDADSDEEDKDFDKKTPRRSQMYRFAGEIVQAIEKNRSVPG